MAKCACKGSFLDRFIQPSVLMTLNKESLHGFLIYKKLIESNILDYTGIDPTGLYRTLKKMELAGLLVAEWDIEDTSQPRKIYSITGEGKECLKHWKATLDLYKNDIEKLSKAVSQSIGEE